MTTCADYDIVSILEKYREILLSTEPNPPTSHTVRACLNETLRLFPLVPQNTRSTVRPTTIPTSELNPDGTMKRIYIPGHGTPIRYTVLLMQRRKDLWGPDALAFVPERWLDAERVKEMTADPFRFIPFNAGPRICLGQVNYTITLANPIDNCRC